MEKKKKLKIHEDLQQIIMENTRETVFLDKNRSAKLKAWVTYRLAFNARLFPENIDAHLKFIDDFRLGSGAKLFFCEEVTRRTSYDDGFGRTQYLHRSKEFTRQMIKIINLALDDASGVGCDLVQAFSEIAKKADFRLPVYDEERAIKVGTDLNHAFRSVGIHRASTDEFEKDERFFEGVPYQE
jgi:hypothetical protein